MTITDPETLSPADAVDDEVVDAAVVADEDAFVRLVQRLSRQSVDKHYDAYADIPWDDPDVRHRPRRSPLRAGSATTRSVAPSGTGRSRRDVRARIGLYRYVERHEDRAAVREHPQAGPARAHASACPTAIRRSATPTTRSSRRRTTALMFQEFVNRSPFDTPGLRWDMRFGAARIVKLGHRFPELFFMFVLGGEDPIDHVQREALRSDDELAPAGRDHHAPPRHRGGPAPLVRAPLPQADRAPARSGQAPGPRGLLTPVILGAMAQIMMQAPSDLIARFDIPAEVVREAYVDNPDHRAETVVALRKVRRLARELGIVTPVSKPVWKALGIWDDDLAAGS